MSLLSLPEETLSQIVQHLPSPDRNNLLLSHPALSATLSPTNEPFWRSIQTTLYPSPPPGARNSHHAILLREAADDYYIHKRLPFDLLSHTPSPALIAHTRAVTHIAAGKVYHTYPPVGRRIRHTLESDATALSASPTPAVGLANGAVYTPLTARVHRGHKAAVTALFQEGALLISGSADRTIRLRDTCTRRMHAVLRGHDAAVSWLFAQRQHLFSAAGSDGRVKQWDVTRAACVSTARPGCVVDAVWYNGCVYAATKSCVHVLDARVGMATVAVLSLPRGWSGIGGLALAEDGALVACVGGGGVAVWDACGGWVARGVGWVRRWEGREGRRLRSVIVGRRGIVAGGGARELLTFARDGGYEGVVAEAGGRKGGVLKLLMTEDGFVVSRSCGRVEMARRRDGVVDWDAAERAVTEERGGARGFWETGSL